jgi:PAT family beta-lactamase induction signal transducer AmpG
MLIPGGTGSAIGLLPGVAARYHVGGDSVAWINGLAGGLLLAGGALLFAAVPWLLQRMRIRMGAMVLASSIYLVNAMTLAILWLGHLDPRTYFIGVTLYMFTQGTGVAAFTSVILEFMGDTGTSKSMRYSLINSLGNVPVQCMILVDGWGGDHFGVRGLAGTECVVGTLASVVFLFWLLIKRPTESAEAPAMRLAFSMSLRSE